MFKRIILTAFLGGALLFTIPNAATAHGGHGDRNRHDNYAGARGWDTGYFGGYSGGYSGGYGGYIRPEYAPRLQFRGFDKVPGFYYAPPSIGAPSAGYYLPYLADAFGDEYFVTYGSRCNGYRDGWYHNRDGARYGNYRHNADCDDFYVRHGYWYGIPACDRYDDAVGYCDSDS
jgi:hypothetical protein